MMKSMNATANQDSIAITVAAVIRTFFIAGLIWLLLSITIAFFSASELIRSLMWSVGLWLLCMLDLFSLAKAGAAVTHLIGGNLGDKRIPIAVQALFWGAIKLVCLGFIGWVLFNAQSAPEGALLMGLGTLVIVPLFGGFHWSQRELNHA